MPDPLTRVDALVAAAVMAHHERRQPAWAGIAARLTAWAHEQPQTEHEEGEMPSQDRVSGSADGTIRTSNRTTPGERVNARTEGLTTDYVGV